MMVGRHRRAPRPAAAPFLPIPASCGTAAAPAPCRASPRALGSKPLLG